MSISKHLFQKAASFGAALLVTLSSVQAPVFAEAQSDSFFEKEQGMEIDFTDDSFVSEDANTIDLTDDSAPQQETATSGSIAQPHSYDGGSTTLLGANIVNSRMKKLAGATIPIEAAGYGINDSNIKEVKWVSTQPADSVVISKSGETEVYAGYKDGVISLYTTASVVYLDDTQLTSPMFMNMQGLDKVDLGKMTVKDGTNLNNMFRNSDVDQITFGPGWRFTTAADLPEGNWSNSADSSVWSTAAIETTADIPDVTFTLTSQAATKDVPEGTFVAYGLTSNNMKDVHTGETFTGFCINDNNHQPHGYYDKVEASAANLVNNELLSSDDYGCAPLGKDMREALITLIYYGTKANLSTSVLQKDIWHFTDNYSDTSWKNADFWADKKFEDIPNAEGMKLYIYRSFDGFQNLLSIEGVEVIVPDIHPVIISKQDVAGKEIAGAQLSITGTKQSGEAIEAITWTSEEGKSHQVELEAGTYTLTETLEPSGYKKASSIQFTIAADGKVTSSAYKDGKIVMTDEYKTYPANISKQDVAGKEIEGATLNVKGLDTANKNVNITWTSEKDKTHVVTVMPGKYRLTETQAPDGYAKAESIDFEVGMDGKVKVAGEQVGTIIMTDEYKTSSVVISKQDIAGKEIAGAKLKITKNGEEIASWTSEKNKSHSISLGEGKYVLTETQAPTGYVKSESITFTVDTDGKVKIGGNSVDKVVMTDEYKEYDVVVSKQDIAGKEIPGAKLSITKGDKEVASWTSEKDKSHTVKLVPGDYVLTEVLEPAGYAKAESISFTVTMEGKVKVGGNNADKVVMTDAYQKHDVVISKQDIAGKEIPGAKLSITQGEKEVEAWTSEKDKSHTVKLAPGDYVLTEVLEPAGYAKAESISFTVTMDGKVKVGGNDVEQVVMKDEYKKHDVTISKQDIAGKEIPGAKLTITDSNKEEVESWTSTEKAHVTKLLPGTYTLTEVLTPEHYEQAEAITFTVDMDGKVKVGDKDAEKVIMVDGYKSHDVVISKQDIAGKEIAGARLVVTDKDKKEVDSWTSEEGKSHTIHVKPGEYTLTETLAPEFYAKAESIKFTVNVDGSVTVGGKNAEKVVMTDKYSPVDVTIRKVANEKGTEFLLAGAKLEIIKTVDKKPVVVIAWTTDTAEKVVSLEPGEYTLHEAEAPLGYDVAADIKFTVDTKGHVQMDGKTLEKNLISMTDKMSDGTKKVVISKIGMDDKGLAGANLEVQHKDTYSSKMIIDEHWTSDGKDHTVSLIPGVYVLHETAAPDGYVVVADITFTVNADGSLTINNKTESKVVMKDAPTSVTIRKVDSESGNNLAGASLKVTDKNGKEIDSWTSDSNAHVIKGKLKAGQEYILHENSAPEGYETAADVHFTVNNNSENLEVVMKDTKKPVVPVEKSSLLIRKVVKGINTNRKFQFMVALTTPDNKPFTGKLKMDVNGGGTVEAQFNNMGYALIQLGNGEYVVFHDIPVGYIYTVTEDDYSALGYTTTNNGNTTSIKSQANVVEFTNTYGTTGATSGGNGTAVVNGRTVTSTIQGRETGDASNYTLIFSILGIAVAAVAGIVVYKKRTGMKAQH